MKNFSIRLMFLFVILVAVCGIFAWAQKGEEENQEQGLTLADLGVTDTQKERLKELWELKRQRHIQAVEGLKTLNRLAKDPVVSDEGIAEALKELRQNRRERDQEIWKAEEELIQTIPERAQLHLTILGVLNNGLPHRRSDTAAQRRKQDEDRSQ